jgi:hypothetical protein
MQRRGRACWGIEDNYPIIGAVRVKKTMRMKNKRIDFTNDLEKIDIQNDFNSARKSCKIIIRYQHTIN